MPDDRDDEFAAAVRRAGLSIPAERWDAMREAYERMREALRVLDDPRAYEDEPATLPSYAGAKP